MQLSFAILLQQTIDVAEVLHTKATDSELVALNKLREYIVMHFTAVWEVVGAETELVCFQGEICLASPRVVLVVSPLAIAPPFFSKPCKISLFREIAEYAMSTLPLPTDAR